ncbi:MAG: hypothetical protein GY792_35110 [Gammaproteobacteria bacterium]|nr:hypothetical protein [Gammaproteobacteria bacterium]
MTKHIGILNAGDKTYLIEQKYYGVMPTAQEENTLLVPVNAVAGNGKLVPADHSRAESTRDVGAGFGD